MLHNNATNRNLEVIGINCSLLLPEITRLHQQNNNLILANYENGNHLRRLQTLICITVQHQQGYSLMSA